MYLHETAILALINHDKQRTTTMKKYKVTYEVSKVAVVNATTKEEACRMVLDHEIEAVEHEITAQPIAYELNT